MSKISELWQGRQSMDLKTAKNTVSRKKVLAVLALGASAALVLAGCSAATPSDNASSAASGEWTPESIAAEYGSVEYGDSWHSLALSIIADRASGGAAAAAALGQTYRGISAEFDAVKQLSDIESAIGTGMMAMNIVPLEAPSVNAFAPIACAAKVPFTTAYNSPAWKTPGEFCPEYTGYTAPNDFETGVITATKLVEALDGKGRIVHIEGLKGATANVLRTLGVQSVLKDYPDIEVAYTIDTNWTGQDAFDQFAAILATDTGTIDGVIAADDDLGVGAFNAARAVDQQPLIVSSDGTQEALGIIAEGNNYLGTVDTGSTYIGGYLMVRLFDAMNGWVPTPSETMMYWPIQWADTDNAAAVLEKTKSAKYDWAKMSRVLYPDTWNTQGLLSTMDPAVVWQTQPMPADYTLPSGFSAEDRAATDALYAEHSK
jgi:ribose transport system substrate-binding protein